MGLWAKDTGQTATPNGKLTHEDRVAILLGVSSEYVTLKVPLAEAKNEKDALTLRAGQDIDFTKLDELVKNKGLAMIAGTVVRITAMRFEKDHILLEINGGGKKGPKWYERIQLGGGGGSVGGGQTRRPPSSNGPDSWQPGSGSWIKLQFDGDIPSLTPDTLKEHLAPVMGFDRASATKDPLEAFPEEFRGAVKEHRAVVGMDRDLVLAAMGRPLRKIRETKDGKELEDWIYGEKPFPITFVTFFGGKVISVKEY